jgi:DNA-binding SARP family transcriptional activator
VTLLVHLLGPAHISRDGQPIAILGHRPLALLAYLLVSGEAHSRQHLVDLLFDSADDPRASLRWTLSKLRRVIGSQYIHFLPLFVSLADQPFVVSSRRSLASAGAG